MPVPFTSRSSLTTNVPPLESRVRLPDVVVIVLSFDTPTVMLPKSPPSAVISPVTVAPVVVA